MCIAKAALKVDEEIQFPNFRSIEIDDKKIIRNYVDEFQPLSCEYSFANIYCWGGLYQNLWSIYKERLVVYDAVNKCSFLPIGKEMTPDELVLFSRNMEKLGMGADIGVVPSQYLEKFPEIKEFYTIVDKREFAEYIYSVDALCDLKGNKLHKKKNLISQFHRKYSNSSVQLMEGTIIEKAKLLADQIYNSHERFLPGIENEHMALIKAFDDFEKIGLEGLCLMIGGDLVAFSVFSPLNNNIYDIHFEKSCYQFKGSAQVINHETAKYLRGKCQYLNREQDLGIKGLRQAKMSYEPETLFKVNLLGFNRSDYPVNEVSPKQ